MLTCWPLGFHDPIWLFFNWVVQPPTRVTMIQVRMPPYLGCNRDPPGILPFTFHDCILWGRSIIPRCKSYLPMTMTFLTGESQMMFFFAEIQTNTPLKTNMSPEKFDGWQIYFLLKLKWSFFRGHSFVFGDVWFGVVYIGMLRCQ